MGVVYLVNHIQTGERLALKVMLDQARATPDAIVRFKREMEAPTHIRSEHVVRITDADIAHELGGRPFLVMELLDGLNVEQVFKHEGTLKAEEVVWILGQVANALDKAHAVGVVHRDLKPENLFVHRREGGQIIVKILDFGIARMTEPSNLGITEVKLTQTGAILGTPMYLSPEQAAGNSAQVGPASDMWSLGLIAFELLVGKSYWTADSVTSLIGQIMFAPMPSATTRAPTLPQAFNEWFARSCNRDQSMRWPSVGAQMDSLAKALSVQSEWLQRVDPPQPLAGILHAHAEQASLSANRAELETEERQVQSTRLGLHPLIQDWLRRPVVWLAGAGFLVMLVVSAWMLGRRQAPSTVTATSAGTSGTASSERNPQPAKPQADHPAAEAKPSAASARKPEANVVAKPSPPSRKPGGGTSTSQKVGTKKHPGVTSFEAAAP